MAKLGVRADDDAMLAERATRLAEMAVRLRTTRLALKLTQARLCRLAGINPQAWNHAEIGRARLGLDSALRLCDQTGLTLDWIYRGLKVGLPLEIAEAIARQEAKQ